MKARIGLLAPLVLALSVGCSILPKDLVAHPSYEVWDNSNLGSDFFNYGNGFLNIEGIPHQTLENEHEYHAVNKEVLNKVLDFVDSKIKIEDGTDIFTSKHKTKVTGQIGRGFYHASRTSGRIQNDHIYIEPTWTDPFEINCADTPFIYNSELLAEILGVYTTVLHEYTHQTDHRSNIDSYFPNSEIKGDLEVILTNELGIIANERGTGSNTDINEVYPHLFEILFLIKYGNDLKAHLQNSYQFNVETDEGFIETTLPDFDMDKVMEVKLNGDYAYRDITNNPYADGFFANKLAKIKSMAPELEKFYAWFRN